MGSEATSSKTTDKDAKRCSVSCKPRRQRRLDASRATESTLVHRHGRPTQEAPRRTLEARRQHETEVDSEAGMLSGISRKRSIRSNPCWFTEFCNSQCLSHFAAPFIVVRAETSVAESCKKAITEQRFPPTGNTGTTQVMRSLVAGRQRGQHLPPRRLAHTHAQAANNHQAQPKSRAS